MLGCRDVGMLGYLAGMAGVACGPKTVKLFFYCRAEGEAGSVELLYEGDGAVSALKVSVKYEQSEKYCPCVPKLFAPTKQYSAVQLRVGTEWSNSTQLSHQAISHQPQRQTKHLK